MTKIDFASGWIGGLTMTCVGHPCDVWKTRLQAASKGPKVSALRVLTNLVRREGVSSLFRGISPPLLMTGVMNASLFGFNGVTKSIVARLKKKRVENLAMPEILMSSLMSVPAYVAVVTPVERLKVFLITEQCAEKSRGTVRIVRDLGFRGLWQGYSVIVCMRAIGLPAYLASYDVSKRYFLNSLGDESSSSSKLLAYMSAGTIAGFTFWFVSYPLDFLKTRRQQASAEGATRITTLVSHIYKNEGGIRAFYRGLVPCLARAGPANAICFGTVEMSKRWLE